MVEVTSQSSTVPESGKIEYCSQYDVNHNMKSQRYGKMQIKPNQLRENDDVTLYELFSHL